MYTNSVGETAKAYQISKSGTTKTTGQSEILGKDDFLRLFIEQLRNQDPMNATDSKEFIAQMAQFSSLEQSMNLNTNIVNLMSMQMVSQASSMLGRTVVTHDASGKEFSGTVSRVMMSSSVPVLVVNGIEVSLGDVEQIS